MDTRSSNVKGLKNDAQVDEWLEESCNWIRAFVTGKDVLEFGCGKGEILSRLAPLANCYDACDGTKDDVDVLLKKLSNPAFGGGKVRHVWAQEEAIDFTEKYDVVVLNFQVCWAGQGHFIRVLSSCISCLTIGGVVLLRDVRNKDLKWARSHCVAANAKDEPLLLCAARRFLSSMEFAISPKYFVSDVKVDFPALQRVNLRCKKGVYANDINMWRYDVELHSFSGKDQRETVKPVEFVSNGTESCVSDFLLCSEPVKCLCGISNPLTEAVVRAARFWDQEQKYSNSLAPWSLVLDETMSVFSVPEPGGLGTWCLVAFATERSIVPDVAAIQSMNVRVEDVHSFLAGIVENCCRIPLNSNAVTPVAASGRLYARVTKGQEALYLNWKHDTHATDPSVQITVRGAAQEPRAWSTASAAVKRHSALRTTSFSRCGRYLLQEINSDSAEFKWSWCVTDNELSAEYSVKLKSLKQWGLENGKIVRCHGTGWESDGLLTLLMHGIVSDSWSALLLQHELKSGLEDSGIDRACGQMWEFAEFEWEVLELEGAALQKWWVAHLMGSRALRLRGTSAHVDTMEGDRKIVRKCSPVPPMVKELFAQASQKAAVSLFAIWQGAFAAWACHNEEAEEQDDSTYGDVLVVGPYWRRDDPRFERTLGFLMNMLVYRYRLSGFETLTELAVISGNVVKESFLHGFWPVVSMIRKCGVKNSLQILNCTFFWNVPGQALNCDISSPNQLYSASCDGLQFSCAAKSDSSGIIELILEGQLRFFLCACQRQNAVHEAQLVEWGAGHPLPLTQATLQKCVSRAYAPNGQLGLFLGFFERGSMVAVSLKRSKMLCEAIIFVAFSGFAFVPVDHSYSLEVAAFRIISSKAKIVATDTAKCNLLQRFNVSCLGFGCEDRARCLVHETSLAYLLYTSGSTGNPKGAAVLQRNVPNLLRWMDTISFNSRLDVFLWQSSISFDFLVYWMFWSSKFQSKLAVVEDSQELDVRLLTVTIVRERVSQVFIVPSHFQMLLGDASFRQQENRIKLVMAGGEALSVGLKRSCNKFHPGVKLWNVYGPTETTVLISYFEASTERTVLETGTVPIGRPFGNTSLHMCSRRTFGGLVCLGNFFISGKSVGGGYFGLVDRTRQQFQYDDIRNDGCGRKYNSGDQATALQSGAFQYLGRNDDQVKVNGQRVELGAVESKVLSCAGVRQCAVLIVGEDTAKSLVAFVVGDTDEWRLKQEVGRRAARHEMPHRIFMLETIPLNTSGKADRAALRGIWERERVRRPEQPRKLLSSDNDIEQSLYDVVSKTMCSVLGVSQVGSGTTFWDLGGTSLTAMALDHALLAATGVQIGLTHLLRDGSVAGIAKVLSSDGVSSLRKLTLRPQSQYRISWTMGGLRGLRVHVARGRSGVGFRQLFLLRVGSSVSLKLVTERIEHFFSSHPITRGRFTEDGDVGVFRVDPSFKPEIEECFFETLDECWNYLRHAHSRFSQVPCFCPPCPYAHCGFIHVGAEKFVFLCIGHEIYDASSLQRYVHEFNLILEGSEKIAPFQEFSKFAEQVESLNPVSFRLSSRPLDLKRDCYWFRSFRQPVSGCTGASLCCAGLLALRAFSGGDVVGAEFCLAGGTNVDGYAIHYVPVEFNQPTTNCSRERLVDAVAKNIREGIGSRFEREQFLLVNYMPAKQESEDNIVVDAGGKKLSGLRIGGFRLSAEVVRAIGDYRVLVQAGWCNVYGSSYESSRFAEQMQRFFFAPFPTSLCILEAVLQEEEWSVGVNERPDSRLSRETIFRQFKTSPWWKFVSLVMSYILQSSCDRVAVEMNNSVQELVCVSGVFCAGCSVVYRSNHFLRTTADLVLLSDERVAKHALSYQCVVAAGLCSANNVQKFAACRNAAVCIEVNVKNRVTLLSMSEMRFLVDCVEGLGYGPKNIILDQFEINVSWILFLLQREVNFSAKALKVTFGVGRLKHPATGRGVYCGFLGSLFVPGVFGTVYDADDNDGYKRYHEVLAGCWRSETGVIDHGT